MSRSICLGLAAFLGVVACNPSRGQDAAGTPSATTPAGTDVAALQAENAALKKEVADAAHTIAELQAKLAKAQKNHHTGTAPAAEASPVPDTASTTPDAASATTNAAPAGPQRALPLDATNANVTAAAPEAPASDASPSRSYTVVKGDSLWKISHKMYPGDTKNGVDKIQEANKDAIGGKPLKIGQVLVIPQ